MRRFISVVAAVGLCALVSACSSAGRFAPATPNAPSPRADAGQTATVAAAPATLTFAPARATATPQMALGYAWGFFFGGGGEDLASSHMDGVHGGLKLKPGLFSGPTGLGSLKDQLVVEGRFEKEWDGEWAGHVLGGLRLTNDTRFKYPYFYEVTAGLLHFPGENVFELHTNVGMIFRKPDRDWAWFARVGLPWAFFEGNMEIGTEFSVGIDFSRKK